MKWIKLYEEWRNDIKLHEALDDFVKGQMALLGTPQEDIEKFEKGLKNAMGNDVEVSVEKKPIEEVSLNKKAESEIKGGSSDSVVILKVKDSNNSLHTFVIPEKKESKPKLNTTGSISLPTIYVQGNNAIDINIGGLRNALNTIAKGGDFDLDKLTAKVSVKHSL